MKAKEAPGAELLTQDQQDARLPARAEKDKKILPRLAEDTLLHFIGKNNPVKQECMKREIDTVRQEAAGSSPSPLESLLAERVALCWAFVQVTEALCYTTMSAGGTVAGSLLHCKRMEIAQRRYLAAIKALAQVRRLKVPAVQINVGAQQVNLAA